MVISSRSTGVDCYVAYIIRPILDNCSLSPFLICFFFISREAYFLYGLEHKRRNV